MSSIFHSRFNKKKRRVSDAKVIAGNENLTTENIGQRFVKAFAVQENINLITSTRNLFPALNGLRALTMIWIIAGHIYIFAFGSTDNIHLGYSYGDSWILQPLIAAMIGIDLFFILSAFLFSFSFHEERKKNLSKNIWVLTFRKILHRYLQMTPAIVVVSTIAQHLNYFFKHNLPQMLIFNAVLAIFLNDTSQFFFPMSYDIEVNCKKYWWRNLLFIQNLYPGKELCLAWSWYVACDFQLFIISSFLLAISTKWV